MYIRKHDSLTFDQDPARSAATPPFVPANPATYCWQIASGTEVRTVKGATTCAAGSSGPIDPSSNGLSVTMTADIPDKIILIAPNKASFILDVPKAKKPADPAPPSVNQNDSVWIEIPVKGVPAGALAEANGIRLEWREVVPAIAGEPVTSIEVHVTRVLTARAGFVDITVTGSNGKKIGSTQLTIKSTHCDTTERK